jgi:hypothetical protein
MEFMKSYIFITTEGYTFQPGSVSSEPDIENCQVIGFAQGMDAQNAFENLVRENAYLLETSLDELICFQFRYEDYWAHRSYFHLSDIRMKL